MHLQILNEDLVHSISALTRDMFTRSNSSCYCPYAGVGMCPALVKAVASAILVWEVRSPSTISLPSAGNVRVTSQLTNGNVISLISSSDRKRINASEAREELK